MCAVPGCGRKHWVTVGFPPRGAERDAPGYWDSYAPVCEAHALAAARGELSWGQAGPAIPSEDQQR